MVVFCSTGIDTEKTKRDKPIVFNRVKVNEGGCYDNTTGVFTTTVPGTYLFTAAVGSGDKEIYVIASMMVDDTLYSALCSSFTSTGSGSASVQLGLGQRVWVKAGSDPNKYFGDELSFTGALLQPQL